MMLLFGCTSFAEVAIGDCMDDEGYLIECDSPSVTYSVIKTWYLKNTNNYPSDEFMSFLGECPPTYTYFFAPTRDSWNQGDRNVSCLRDVLKGKSNVPYTQATISSKINVGDCLSDDYYAVRCDSPYAKFYVMYSHWVQDLAYPEDEFRSYEKKCPRGATNVSFPEKILWLAGDKNFLCMRPN